MSAPISFKISGSRSNVNGLTILGGLLVGYPDGYTIHTDKARGVNIIGTKFEVSDPTKRPIAHIESTENTKTIVFSGFVLSPSLNRERKGTDFSDKVVVLQNFDSRAFFPYGVGSSSFGFEYQTPTRIPDKTMFLDSSTARLNYKNHNSVIQEIVTKEVGKALNLPQGVDTTRIALAYKSASEIGNNQLYVDSSSGKLTWKDKDGISRPLY